SGGLALARTSTEGLDDLLSQILGVSVHAHMMHDGSDTLQLAVEPSETTTRASVKALVSQSTAITNLKLGRGRTIYGSVTPAHAGSVKLTIRRNAVVVSTKSLTLSSSRYSFVYKPPSTGTYSFVVSYAGDVDYLGNTSPTKSFKVVK
ncbi:MAG: Ig-like domain-containing protein, partial [Actinomycetota bacterium]|nr:Ig-like domain-containing protein [Actinomycetota bacterium]